LTNLLYLIPLALFLGGLGLAAFVWSLRSGQYDDLDAPPQDPVRRRGRRHRRSTSLAAAADPRPVATTTARHPPHR
jgi:cbb3-type cytochrome oxidase maturation protein